MAVFPGPGLRPGFQEKLYTSFFSDPQALTEIPIVGDLSLNLDLDKAEVKSRSSEWKSSIPTLKGAPLEFDMLADTSDKNYDFLRDAYIKLNPVLFAICDQDIHNSGAEYFIAFYYIFGFTKDQKLENVEMVKIKADLAYGILVDGDPFPPVFVNVA